MSSDPTPHVLPSIFLVSSMMLSTYDSKNHILLWSSTIQTKNNKQRTLVGGYSEKFNCLLYVLFQQSKNIYQQSAECRSTIYSSAPSKKVLPSSNQRNLNLNSQGCSSSSSLSSHIRPYYNLQKDIPPKRNYSSQGQGGGGGEDRD